MEEIHFKFYCEPYRIKLLSSDCSKIQERKFKRNAWVTNDIKNKRRDLCEGCSGPVPLPDTDSEIIQESRQEGKTMPEQRTCKTEGCENTDLCLTGYCRKCHGGLIAKGLQASKKFPKNRHRFFLDFQDYPELFEQLHDIARKEFRTVEMQALWFLLRGMEKG